MCGPVLARLLQQPLGGVVVVLQRRVALLLGVLLLAQEQAKEGANARKHQNHHVPGSFLFLFAVCASCPQC